RYAKGDTKRAGTIGGFSEYILIPNAKRNHSLYAVDDCISDKLASLIEPFTVGCRAARRGMIGEECPDSKPRAGEWGRLAVGGAARRDPAGVLRRPSRHERRWP
ncbi:MAG: hypothetical protein E7E29_24330, partial [Pseudomonas aeruginosa]|nr:hypothetical protein [Pseudomonas aeruginosa]